MGATSSWSMMWVDITIRATANTTAVNHLPFLGTEQQKMVQLHSAFCRSKKPWPTRSITTTHRRGNKEVRTRGWRDGDVRLARKVGKHSFKRNLSKQLGKRFMSCSKSKH